jgi:hypothetical protein
MFVGKLIETIKQCECLEDVRILALNTSKKDLEAVCINRNIPYKKSWNKLKLMDTIIKHPL